LGQVENTVLAFQSEKRIWPECSEHLPQYLIAIETQQVRSNPSWRGSFKMAKHQHNLEGESTVNLSNEGMSEREITTERLNSGINAGDGRRKETENLRYDLTVKKQTDFRDFSKNTRGRHSSRNG
jgi:hypothetical protein